MAVLGLRCCVDFSLAAAAGAMSLMVARLSVVVSPPLGELALSGPRGAVVRAPTLGLFPQHGEIPDRRSNTCPLHGQAGS